MRQGLLLVVFLSACGAATAPAATSPPPTSANAIHTPPAVQPTPSSTQPTRSATQATSEACAGLQSAMLEAEMAIDVAGASLKTEPGVVRSALEHWMAESVSPRADRLRDAARGLSVEVSEAIRTLAVSLDSLAQHVRASAPYGEDYDATDREFDHSAFVVCGDALPGHYGKGGRLTPEAIQLIVRTSFGRFRKCYEDGLAKRRDLTGVVKTKFVIDRSGAVSTTADAGSDLPDPTTVGCVVDGFRKLQFGPPRGGIVTVVYPIMFRPSD